MNPSFKAMPFTDGEIYTSKNINVIGLLASDMWSFTDGTYFVFVAKGIAWVNGDTPLKAGMYGCFTTGRIRAEGHSRILIIQVLDYDGMRIFGGPLEQQGRLKYIDGCTDSLLIPPVKLGDPCLNHLHFPAGINQTMHTHPSIRIGYVYRGIGQCVTPWGTIPLIEGMVFIIKLEDGTFHEGSAVGSHCFRTDLRTMDIVAFHPDSDFGPTDEVHPMINRTIVDGVSASTIKEIRTK